MIFLSNQNDYLNEFVIQIMDIIYYFHSHMDKLRVRQPLFSGDYSHNIKIWSSGNVSVCELIT